MADRKRVFTSFAVEDRSLRDLLVGQARNAMTPFELTDMSVKEPWDSSWKTRCRTKIRGCDGVVGIITKNTSQADGQLWELGCAIEEGLPVLLLYGSQHNRPAVLPEPIRGRQVFAWTWEKIATFVSAL